MPIIHDKKGKGCTWVFFNQIKGSVSKIYYPDGIKCAGCNKRIKKSFYKKGMSFDIFHPKCYKKTKADIIICDDIVSSAEKKPCKFIIDDIENEVKEAGGEATYASTDWKKEK